MKKSLILAGMLAVGYANAQEGNVGINTETPKATLEVLPSAKNLAGTTNEGIIIPKLTKARVLAIATDKLVEGTKVYVTDEVTDDDTQFIGTGKGFYFYNGTKWVKQLDSDANTELWAQRNNAGVTETYLKPADEKADFIGYTSNRKWGINLGNVIESDFTYGNTALTKGLAIPEVPFLTAISSDALPDTSTVGANNKFFFNHNNTLLKESHASKNPTGRYYGQENRFVVKDVTSRIGDIYGFNGSTEVHSNNTINNVIGIQGLTSVGSDNGAYITSKVTNTVGANIAATNNAISTNMYGGRFYVRNYGTANHLRGVYAVTDSQSTVNGANAEHTVSSIRGIQNYTNLNDNGTLTEYIWGIHNSVSIGNNTKFNNSSIRGIYSRINIATTEHTNTIVNYSSIFNPVGTTITRYEDFTSYPIIGENTKIKDFIGFRAGSGQYAETSTIENYYGIHIEDITRGTNSNFAIHTGRGLVRFGELKGTGNRNVYADKDGVLRAGDEISATNGIQNQSAMKCDATNAGKINYTTIQIEGEEKGIFGFCMQKGTEYVWAYMVGGANIYGTSANGAAFGEGLQ